MGFVEPAFLWGALAIVVPIAVHFWHQKRGKPLPWAATLWLTERDQQSSRGLRLDNVLLLIVRCLLLIVLAILLSQPLLNWVKKAQAVQRVHLVQPRAFVADNFRFELAEARKNGERIYWADETPEPFDDERKPSPKKSYRFDALTLQSAINQISPENTELHLYVVNDPALAEVPAITVPTGYRLHTVVDSTSQLRAFLTGKGDRKLFINRAGLLTSSVTLDPTLRFQTSPVHSGPLRVLLDYRTQPERETVRAALNALTEIYSLDLVIDERQTTTRPYDWVLTDRLPSSVLPQTIYVVSGVERTQSAPNVVFTNEPLTPQRSERVENGQLPEWLGEQLIRHYDLPVNRSPLSKAELRALFVPTRPRDTRQQAGVQNALLLLFVVILLIERGLALTKNA